MDGLSTPTGADSLRASADSLQAEIDYKRSIGITANGVFQRIIYGVAGACGVGLAWAVFYGVCAAIHVQIPLLGIK